MNSYSTYPQKRASLGFGNLQVSTQEDPERAIQIDENEYTARPGNAHAHASFHSSLEAAAAANGGTSAGQGASGSAGETSLILRHFEVTEELFLRNYSGGALEPQCASSTRNLRRLVLQSCEALPETISSLFSASVDVPREFYVW